MSRRALEEGNVNTDGLVYTIVLALSYATLGLVCEIGRRLVGRGAIRRDRAQGAGLGPT